MQTAWRSWTGLYAASLSRKKTTLKSHFKGWKKAVFSFDLRRRALLRVRFVVGKYLTRQVNELQLQVAALFGRWRHRCGLSQRLDPIGSRSASPAALSRLAAARSLTTPTPLKGKHSHSQVIQSQLQAKLFGSRSSSRPQQTAIQFASPHSSRRGDTSASSSFFLRRPHLTPSDPQYKEQMNLLEFV
mmetsp:Transcript_23503/g.33649  ORF Transcript_23503/g.33649 Transcript_23503/m.33649 type:complete len:187 (+) Transcript_23503:2741-3301(+)